MVGVYAIVDKAQAAISAILTEGFVPEAEIVQGGIVMCDWNKENIVNPLTRMDYPDPDVIRVEDTYYMVSTTMHFMPGCEILRSYDLKQWEHISYVYDYLDGTPGQRLEGEAQIYGKGMWAASLRFHKGTYYVIFVANDTHTTYLYRAEDIRGPWRKSTIQGFYHDCSLLFDDDDRIYLAYGNTEIHIQELKADLSGPKEDGLHRIAVVDVQRPCLGYEGTHFYKIGGKYYLFFIHSLKERWRRVEACFVADSIEGEFTGKDVLNDDRGYCDQGVAQGGIVDTPDGRWYGILFQDSGAVGRIPVLVPVHFEGDYPVFGIDGKVPVEFETPKERPGYSYTPLAGSDDFRQNADNCGLAEDAKRLYGCFGLKSCWQFNHEPDLSLTCQDTEKGTWRVTTDKLCDNVTQAKNTLTQRMTYPGCSAQVTVDGSLLKCGDYAGICALQGCYGMIGLTKEADGYYLVMRGKAPEDVSLQAKRGTDYHGQEYGRVFLGARANVRLKIDIDFTNMKDEAHFYYHTGEGWTLLGNTHKLAFKLDHFTGCRFGLFVYATKETGGSGVFGDFRYEPA